MSRIEKALEKAGRMRNGEQAVEAPPHRSRPKGVELARLFDVPPLEVNNPMLTLGPEPNIVVSEEYNKLQSLVVAFSRGTSFRNTLLVTSSVSSEGKTMTALNLSIALARGYDHTVLLVDADLRRPSVHRYLGIHPEIGLSQCLKDGVPLERALIKTGIGKLVILPAGGSISDPVELLSSNRMKDLVHELKHRYPERFVLFDTPPATSFADARVLADIVDGTVFVVREGVVNANQFKKTIDSFSGEKLVGAVFNDASAKIQNRYCYY